MANDEKIFEETLEIISDGKEELSELKKAIYDKNNGQTSVKIPKKISLKKGLSENSVFEIVFNPSKETAEEAHKSGLIIFLKEEEKDGEGKERT